MFQQLIASNPSRASRKPLTLVYSAIIHGFLILLLIAVPLVHRETLANLQTPHGSSAAFVCTEKNRCEVDLHDWKASPSSCPPKHTVYPRLHSAQN